MIKTGITLLLLLVAGTASAQSHLDRVMQSKVLTVCTTGDYKPYSFLRPDGEYEGIDVAVAQLNKPSVRLIEPPGGTNEAFVRQYLPQGNLTLFDDNVAIFQQLVDKKADVMITDASEARYQQKRYPQLCAVNPERPMQYGEKAYMLPRDDIGWKMYVDQWLHLSYATGEYQQVVGEWLAVTH